MPNKRVEAARVAHTPHDKRVKLGRLARAEILVAHGAGVSIRRLAREYDVSRRLIQFVVCKESHIANLAARAARGGWRQHYDRGKHAEYMRRHRAYKATLLMAGKL